MRRLLDNQKVLKEIVGTVIFKNIKGKKETMERKERFKALVNNDVFWSHLEIVFRPTSVLVGLLESNSSNLADIYKVETID